MFEFEQKQNIFDQAFIDGTLPLSEYNKYKKLLNEKIRAMKNTNKNIMSEDDLTANDLYDRYRRKKINEDEFLYLQQNTLNKIIVFHEKVVFDTKFGIFEHKRKTLKRNKGITKHSRSMQIKF